MISLILAASVATIPTCADLPKLEAQYRTFSQAYFSINTVIPSKDVLRLMRDRDQAYAECGHTTAMDDPHVHQLDKAFDAVARRAKAASDGR